jgi:hypothetical protein
MWAMLVFAMMNGSEFRVPLEVHDHVDLAERMGGMIRALLQRDHITIRQTRDGAETGTYGVIMPRAVAAVTWTYEADPTAGESTTLWRLGVPPPDPRG